MSKAEYEDNLFEFDTSEEDLKMNSMNSHPSLSPKSINKTGSPLNYTPSPLDIEKIENTKSTENDEFKPSAIKAVKHFPTHNKKIEDEIPNKLSDKGKISTKNENKTSGDLKKEVKYSFAEEKLRNSKELENKMPVIEDIEEIDQIDTSNLHFDEEDTQNQSQSINKNQLGQVKQLKGLSRFVDSENYENSDSIQKQNLSQEINLPISQDMK